MAERIRWRNWAGTETATPSGLARPADVDEIAMVVGAAAASGTRIRPTGSGHSCSGVGRPDGIQLAFDRFADLIRLDRDTGLVTVQPGMTLRRLNRLLADAGLAMTNLSDIDAQTVAGAIATGTHGTGAAFGGLATQVRELELVLADGSVVSCSPDHRPELFSAARVSLGALGVVSAITLQAVPLFALRAEQGPVPLDEALARFDEWTAAIDHVQFSWFPHTRSTLVKRNTRLGLRDGLAPLTRSRRWLDDELASNTVFGALVTTGRHLPRVIRPAAKISARGLAARAFTDLSFEVFTSPRRVRFKEMEYAVARADLLDVVREVVKVVERGDLAVSFPVEVRVAAADDIPLSTASGRESGYVAVCLDHRSRHEPYFDAVEEVFTAAGGRPHWGTMHTLDAADLRGHYPRFDEFVALRDEVDPTGVFTNTYLDRVLGPPPSFPPGR